MKRHGAGMVGQMRQTPKIGQNAYRLVLEDDGRGLAHTIEIDALGPESALFLAQRHCAGRRVEVFENGRSLGSIRAADPGGFWVLTPPLRRLGRAARSGETDPAARDLPAGAQSR